MACVLSALQVRRDGLQDFFSWGDAMNQRSLAATYRPEIDGLRAIAVLAVIIFHFNEHLLPSGFLGVDVFFVISGFVITASLARHQESDWRPFLLGFYARRIKRLIPLLMTCILVTMLVGAFVISPGSDEFNSTWTTGIAALFGVSNITLQAQQSDYFASSTALNPFTHTWSLGVEEQFYFLFPILVFASGFSRHRPGAGRNLGLALALLSLASLVGWIVMNGRDPDWTFYFFSSPLLGVGRRSSGLSGLAFTARGHGWPRFPLAGAGIPGGRPAWPAGVAPFLCDLGHRGGGPGHGLAVNAADPWPMDPEAVGRWPAALHRSDFLRALSLALERDFAQYLDRGH
jgi:peptidoglycan/LPS O-acetylase OafA/YrhL